MSDPVETRATRSRSRSLERRERENGKNGHALTRSENESERVRTTERLTEELRQRQLDTAAEWAARCERTRVLREQLAAARAAGLASRQAARLRRMAAKLRTET